MQVAYPTEDRDHYTVAEAAQSLLLAVVITAIPASVAFLNLSA